MLGGVGTKPWRSAEVERALAGRPATRAVFEEVAPLALLEARTTPHNAFKVPLARRTLIAALERAAEQQA